MTIIHINGCLSVSPAKALLAVPRDKKAVPRDKKDESGVQKTLDTYTTVISRMAESSRQCKTWSVTLVSAILVVAFKNQDPYLLLITVIPIFSLFFIDLYYLKMERHFRHSCRGFVAAFHRNELHREHLYTLKPYDFDYGKVNIDDYYREPLKDKDPKTINRLLFVFRGRLPLVTASFYFFMVIVVLAGAYFINGSKISSLV